MASLNMRGPFVLTDEEVNRRVDDGKIGNYAYVYFGKAESLSNRFYVHHKENSIRAYQANCIGICCLNEFHNSEILERAEKDVLSAIKFPCNEVNN